MHSSPSTGVVCFLGGSCGQGLVLSVEVVETSRGREVVGSPGTLS